MWSGPIVTSVLMTVAVLLATAGRALQLHRDWVQNGLTYFTYPYLVAVLVGNLLLAEVSRRVEAPVAMWACLGAAALYGWMVGSKLRWLIRTRSRRIRV